MMSPRIDRVRMIAQNPAPFMAATLLDGSACQGSAPPSYCGKVLVTGGFAPATNMGIASAELYDPAAGTWAATGALPLAATNHGATLLAGRTCSAAPAPAWCGKVLVVSNQSAFVYDPATGTWATSGGMSVPRVEFSTTQLDGPQCAASPAPGWCGKVLVAGGRAGPTSPPWYASVELYDPAAGTWSLTGSMSGARFQHTATLLGGTVCTQQPTRAYCGSVIAVGGWTSNFNPDPNAEIYNPATATWSSTGALITPRINQAAALLADGRVLVAGGQNAYATNVVDLNSAELYNPNTGAFVSTNSLLTARSFFPFAQLSGGAVLAVGPSTSVELYTPANPAATLSTGALAFERTLVGSASATQTVTVSNAGTVPLTMSTATIGGADPGDFRVSADGCSGTSVAPSSSCSVQVQFTPTAPLARTGLLNIADNAAGSPQTVTLSGTADSALLAATGSDGQLYSRQDAGAFTPLGGQLTGAPAVVTMPGASGTLPSPLYLGIGTDRNVYVRSATQSWQPFTNSPVACLDSLGAAVSSSSTGLMVTVGCEGTDHALYYAQAPLVSTALPVATSWTGLGGVLGAGPAVVNAGGRINFYVTGSNGSVWVRDTTRGYVAMSYQCSGHPAVSVLGSVTYFACDGTDGALWYAVNSGLGWPAATRAGGAVTGGPGIAATTNQAAVYVEGSNGAVYHVTLTPSGTATSFVVDGGVVQSGVAAAGLVS
jgi:hypothetical protein